jgi:hypothetical protein
MINSGISTGCGKCKEAIFKNYRVFPVVNNLKKPKVQGLMPGAI